MKLERGFMIKPDPQDCFPYNIVDIKTLKCIKCHLNALNISF